MVIIVLLLVTAEVIVLVVPAFSEVYLKLGVQLPGPTRALIFISDNIAYEHRERQAGRCCQQERHDQDHPEDQEAHGQPNITAGCRTFSPSKSISSGKPSHRSITLTNSGCSSKIGTYSARCCGMYSDRNFAKVLLRVIEGSIDVSFECRRDKDLFAGSSCCFEYYSSCSGGRRGSERSGRAYVREDIHVGGV